MKRCVAELTEEYVNIGADRLELDRCMKTERVLQVRPGMAGSSFLRRPQWCKESKIIKR